MNYPKVELELTCSAGFKEKGFFIPKVKKLRLTEASEEAIFGDLSPYRDSVLPPLIPAKHFCEKKLAVIDNEQVKVYNKRQLGNKEIKAGFVEVSRSGWDVKLKNVESPVCPVCGSDFWEPHRIKTGYRSI